MTLGSFSVRNPVLLNLITILILLAGAFSLTRLPREQFSEIPFYFVNIVVPYPGVSAEDIEESVTTPVENAMAGLSSLNEINSTTSEGLSVVTLQFDQGLNDDQFDSLFQEVQNRFTNIDLPDGTLQATIDDFSTNDFLPVVEVVLSGPVPYEVLNLAAENLADQLQTISDLSGVTLVGTRDREITIELQQARLEALGISLNEVVNAVRAQNITIPGGTFRTSSREFLLRTVGQLEAAEQFRRIVVRSSSTDGAGIVRLGDIAVINSGFDDSGTQARLNGEQAISLRITKVPGGSSVGILDDVRDRVTAFEPNLPDGISVAYFNDSTIAIRDSLNVLVSNAVVGLGLLVVILLLFIGVRNALMTALGIPITFALTFIILDALGETLNSNTLFGLVLVLGLIVDHAIVIVENSYRLQQQKGMSRHDAAIHGVNQVIVPVIAATLTTVAAFLPLTFLPGIIGRFLRVVPLTVSIALIVSTIEAGLFLPSHYADWPGQSKDSGRSKRVEQFQHGFRRVLTVLYARRGLVTITALVIMIGAFASVGLIRQDLFSAEDATLYFVDIEMPPGTPISRTDEIIREYERRLLPQLGNGEVVAINASVGFTGGDSGNVRQSNVGQIVVDLTEQNEGRTRSIPEIMAEAQLLTADIAGPESVQFRTQQNGPPTDPPVVFRLFGDSFEELAAVSAAIRGQLATYPELTNIEDNLDAGSPELRIRVDETRAAEFGLSSQLVGQFIRGSFDGIVAGSIFAENRETDVIVRYGSASEATIDGLLQLKIPTPDGRLVPFTAIAEIEEATALASIRRLDGKREVTITAEATNEDNLQAVNAAIEDLYLSDLQVSYPGVVLDVGGQFAEIADTLREILRVFVIGIFLIYLVLATQFNSYSQPILVLLTVPFAFVGVILFLVISGTPLSTTVIYASVALAGIAVNDTIVLVSFANETRRDDGLSVGEAVTEAAVTRVRPIFLTSITTIAGLIPTALGIGGESVVWGPMASTIIFGLIFSTLTSLIIVPSLYGLFYDPTRREARKRRRAERRDARRRDQITVADDDQEELGA